jgi:hypothetical protein
MGGNGKIGKEINLKPLIKANNEIKNDKVNEIKNGGNKIIKKY